MNEIFTHTDLYQLNMGYTYFILNKHSRKSVFEVYFRSSKQTEGHHIFAGLEQIIELIENFRISNEELEYLEKNFDYSKEYLNYLKNLKFTGNIKSVYEGEVVFANEPLLVVEAPIVQSLLLETAILNIINYQTLITSIASNITIINEKSSFSEFGARRAYGLEAAMLAARSSYIGGFEGTSLVSAAKRYDIPAMGTHSHAFVQSFPTEYEAFYAYATTHQNVVFLIDTYDVINSGIRNAISVYKELEGTFNFLAVRLDSGDLLSLSKVVRVILDEAGLRDVKIIVSNDLDKKAVRYLIENNAPIDSWGIGTKLVTASDVNSLGCVYKLVQMETNDRKMGDVIKISADSKKTTTPGSKQLVRVFKKENSIYDIIISENEQVNIEEVILASKSDDLNFKVLLKDIVRNGEIVYKSPTTVNIRKYCDTSKNYFSKKILNNTEKYKVIYSEKLIENKKKLEEYSAKKNSKRDESEN